MRIKADVRRPFQVYGFTPQVDDSSFSARFPDREQQAIRFGLTSNSLDPSLTSLMAEYGWHH